MSNLNRSQTNSEELYIESIIAINIEKILTSAQNELNNKNFEAALKMLSVAKAAVEKDLQASNSKLLLELKDKIMIMVSIVYFEMEKFDDCFQNDKEVINIDLNIILV